ncbi:MULTISPECIES: hypothetical protein [Mycobacteriaceae]|uniref:Uncharacterized protein n=1 Tax=Mycolicibacterium neoaurum VKM Ac-1815D TaxID=700508 RepID=V5X7H9_MYCNE|nr:MULTISPECIES: hypothetical protein [Mycobacteriaceae]AMO04305.1 hypothetical protein MyAD_02925 [Mycolicibacterium neoaurum]AXK77412.1 hypothetical protein DXK33_22210 [Mycolicibacterium neoaurum]KUM07508.1 hypothetical protein AVZ31_16210 [Mycolicibacterium neoaurum]
MTSQFSQRFPTVRPQLGANQRARLIAWISTVTIGAGYATFERFTRGLFDTGSGDLGDSRGDQIPGEVYARHTYSRVRDEINVALRRCGYGDLTAVVEDCARRHLDDAVAPAVWGFAFERSSRAEVGADICDGLDREGLALAARLSALFDAQH